MIPAVTEPCYPECEALEPRLINEQHMDLRRWVLIGRCLRCGRVHRIGMAVGLMEGCVTQQADEAAFARGTE